MIKFSCSNLLLLFFLTFSLGNTHFLRGDEFIHSAKAKALPTPVPEIIPGIIETLDHILYNGKDQFKKLESRTPPRPLTLNELYSAKNVTLNPHFLQSLLLFSSSNYLELAINSECHFWALVENGLLKTARGSVSTIIVDFQKKSGEWSTQIAPLDIFLQYTYQRKCFKNREIKQLFSLDNIKKTFDNASFRVPKNKNDCLEILYSWKKDNLTPHLCRISHDLKLQQELATQMGDKEILSNANRRREYQLAQYFSNKITTLLSGFQISYIHNLCKNLDNPEQFCRTHLSASYWSKLLKSHYSPHHFEPICQGILNKNSITSDDYTSCALTLEKNSEICLYNNATRYLSLLPHPSCDLLAKGLENSHYRGKYQDCPGKIDNESLVTAMRVLAHVEKDETLIPPEKCADYPISRFLDLVLKEGSRKIWNMEACYKDIINQTTVCLPLFLGSIENNPYSEDKVITQIIIKVKNAPKNSRCELIEKSNYKPHLLSFKRGCFIVFDNRSCNSMKCPKKIYYNEEEVKEIYYNQGILFHYFPINLKDRAFAISNLILKDIPQNKREKEVRNLTEAKFYLDQSKNNIIHGMGCREDLLPYFFQKTVFNQCTPITFIISGYYSEKMKEFMVVTTGMDDLSTPRLIGWNQIFSSITSYKNIHPLNSWNLYVVSP